jgi:hypothetical protein
MTNRQTNLLNMYRAVLLVLENNQAMYANHAFADLVVNLKAKLASLQVAAQQQERVTTGVTQNKMQLKLELAELALTISALVKSYASRNKLLQLKDEADFYISDLRDCKDEVLIARAQEIYERATANYAALVPYGVTEDLLETFHASIEEFGGKKSTARVAKNERTVATSALANLFDETNAMLKDEMDTAIIFFKREHPQFVELYKNARKIVDIGHRSGGEQAAPEEPVVK